MNVRDKVLLLAFFGLLNVLAMVVSYPIDATDTQVPQEQDQHQQHNHRRGWGGHGRGGHHEGCKHKSNGGNWHHHHHNHTDGHHGGGWHHHHEGGHGRPGNQGHETNEGHRGQEAGPPGNPLTQDIPLPQRPIVAPKKPEPGYIVPTTPAQRPIQTENNKENIDDTIANIFNTNPVNRIDDETPIRPLVDVRDGDISKPPGVPSISDLVLAGDFSKIK